MSFICFCQSCLVLLEISGFYGSSGECRSSWRKVQWKEQKPLLRENYVLDAISQWLRIIMPRAASNDWYPGYVLNFTQLKCMTIWERKLTKIMIAHNLHSWNLPPFIKGVGKGVGVGPSKNWVTWGGSTKNFGRNGDNPEKGGGVDVEMGEGRLPVFYCFAVQLHLLCVWGGGVSFLYYILVFHSNSLQRMLTALYKLAWNTQKSACTNSFKYQGKMVLDIENVLVS